MGGFPFLLPVFVGRPRHFSHKMSAYRHLNLLRRYGAPLRK